MKCHGEEGDADKIASWHIVYRNKKPVAAFPLQAMATGWIQEAPHRKKDTIAARKITFKGIRGYDEHNKPL